METALSEVHRLLPILSLNLILISLQEACKFVGAVKLSGVCGSGVAVVVVFLRIIPGRDDQAGLGSSARRCHRKLLQRWI